MGDWFACISIIGNGYGVTVFMKLAGVRLFSKKRNSSFLKGEGVYATPYKLFTGAAIGGSAELSPLPGDESNLVVTVCMSF